MAAVSKMSSPVQVILDCKLETPLPSPAKYKDRVNCQPWDSRGRRLFPQRRPSFPTSVGLEANAIPGFPPFQPSPSRDQSRIDYDEHDSNTSSPSSVESGNTVKVRMSSTPNRSVPETDPRFADDARAYMSCLAGSLPRSCLVRPLNTHKSSKKSLETSFASPLYTNAIARGNLQWKSMSQFHKSRHRPRPRILSQLPNGEQAPRDSDKSHDPPLLPNNPFKCDSTSGIGPCHWSQSPKITAHPGLSPIEVSQGSCREEDPYVVTQSHNYPDDPVFKIATWDCAVTLSTVATVDDNGRLHVHHLVLVSVNTPMEQLYAEKISLSFVVTNALRTDRKCNLEPGQSSLLFEEDVSQPGFFPRQGIELVIVRDIRDLEKPLSLYFAFTYPSPQHFVMASLPTLRPKQGRSLSEVVFIAEPRPPLSMRTYIRDPLSSWKLCHHPISQVTCYERTDSPRFYPPDYQDDIEIRISELDSVRFQALGESTLANMVWEFDMQIHELPGRQIECRMSFFIVVQAATTSIVSLDSQGWVPKYFIIDGYVATEKAGECWKRKEGHITIFKQNHIGPGPILIETYWQGLPKDGNDDVYGKGGLPLPGVVDCKILGGRLTCQASEVILLNHLGERIRSYAPIDGTYTLLPTMDAGYRILLKRIPEPRTEQFCRPDTLRPSSLSISKDTRLCEHAFLNPDAETDKVQKTGLSHTADNVDRGAAPAKPLLQPLLLSLLVLLLLVPGFLLFIEHVREGNNHNEFTLWRDRDRSSLGGKRTEAIIDVAGSGPLRPVDVAVDDPVEVAKCKGWRDWIDYESGWKGCVP